MWEEKKKMKKSKKVNVPSKKLEQMVDLLYQFIREELGVASNEWTRQKKLDLLKNIYPKIFLKKNRSKSKKNDQEIKFFKLLEKWRVLPRKIDRDVGISDEPGTKLDLVTERWIRKMIDRQMKNPLTRTLVNSRVELTLEKDYSHLSGSELEARKKYELSFEWLFEKYARIYFLREEIREKRSDAKMEAVMAAQQQLEKVQDYFKKQWFCMGMGMEEEEEEEEE